MNALGRDLSGLLVLSPSARSRAGRGLHFRTRQFEDSHVKSGAAGTESSGRTSIGLSAGNAGAERRAFLIPALIALPPQATRTSGG
jgi:hypothetical protein